MMKWVLCGGAIAALIRAFIYNDTQARYFAGIVFMILACTVIILFKLDELKKNK